MSQTGMLGVSREMIDKHFTYWTGLLTLSNPFKKVCEFHLSSKTHMAQPQGGK